MTATEHQAKVDALVVIRQRLHQEREENRRLLAQALFDQGQAAERGETSTKGEA